MAQIKNKVVTFILNLKNKILTNIYDFLLKRQESKLSFKKDLLTIKTEEYQLKAKKQKEKAENRYLHRLMPYEVQAGIESDYVKNVIEEKVEEVNDKYYWKKRVIEQKIKRSKSAEKTKHLEESLLKLEREKQDKIQDIKNKYQNPQPTEEDKALYEEKKALFLQDKKDAIEKADERMNEKIHQLQVKTKAAIEKYESKIGQYKETLLKLEQALKDVEDTYVLEKGVALSLENLSMHFGGLKAVDDLSFDVKEGEIFGLIGPNGAGKTTVFNCITRFYKPTYGHMYFNNHNQKTIHLNDIAVHNIIKEGIVRTFQNVELVWELNILDNLLVAAHSVYRSNFFGHSVHSRLTKREETIYTRRAMKILDDLDLTQYTYAYPIGLPYGVLKKVELARTLMSNPKMIILDEPAAGLNDKETKELAEFIKKIRDEYDVTIFLVEHDMGLVMSICDTVCAISFGKKLAIGTPKEIQQSKVVQEAYLGGD